MGQHPHPRERDHPQDQRGSARDVTFAPTERDIEGEREARGRHEQPCAPETERRRVEVDGVGAADLEDRRRAEIDRDGDESRGEKPGQRGGTWWSPRSCPTSSAPESEAQTPEHPEPLTHRESEASGERPRRRRGRLMRRLLADLDERDDGATEGPREQSAQRPGFIERRVHRGHDKDHTPRWAWYATAGSTRDQRGESGGRRAGDGVSTLLRFCRGCT